MRRLRHPSFAVQLALLLGAALLVAQAVNFGLILNDRQKLSLATNEGPAIARFAAVAANLDHLPAPSRDAFLDEQSGRGTYFDLTTKNDVAIPDDAGLTAQLRAALVRAGVSVRAVHLGSQIPTETMPKGDKPAHSINPADAYKRYQPQPGDVQLLRFSLQRPDGSWLTARMYTPRRDPFLTLRLLAATTVLYLVVLLTALWFAARMTRPLRALTTTAEAFGGRTPPPHLEPSGPQDIARAITAFNAMNQRLVELLDEKDHMMGAIGHDLRTPLASVRIRLEGMEPAQDREAAIGRIEQAANMLDDILLLARTGRARAAPQKINVTGLAEAVVEDQVELGRPVTFDGQGRELILGQPDQLRRALGNLIENAVTYGGSALVEVSAQGETIEIAVSDPGPGIPAAELATVMALFHRREASRNRETGGSGLGLPIAQSIAQSHGGSLVLDEAEGGGLRARLIFPTLTAAIRPVAQGDVS